MDRSPLHGPGQKAGDPLAQQLRQPGLGQGPQMRIGEGGEVKQFAFKAQRIYMRPFMSCPSSQVKVSLLSRSQTQPQRVPLSTREAGGGTAMSAQQLGS